VHFIIIELPYASYLSYIKYGIHRVSKAYHIKVALHRDRIREVAYRTINFISNIKVDNYYRLE
jgi:hypothetical protein